jgi:hypothetical protein
MANREKLAEFVAWSQQHITGDEKGQAQIRRSSARSDSNRNAGQIT